MMYVPGAPTPELFQLRLEFVTSTSPGRLGGRQPIASGAAT
jgi:hypothetical protein